MDLSVEPMQPNSKVCLLQKKNKFQLCALLTRVPKFWFFKRLKTSSVLFVLFYFVLLCFVLLCFVMLLYMLCVILCVILCYVLCYVFHGNFVVLCGLFLTFWCFWFLFSIGRDLLGLSALSIHASNGVNLTNGVNHQVKSLDRSVKR